MRKNRCIDYVQHIEEEINNIFDFTRNLELSDFLEDLKTQKACIMSITIIGEASTKLINEYPNFIIDNPNIPWKSIRGMRNNLIHGYFNIDIKSVWETIKDDILKLQEQIPSLKISARELDKN